MHRDSVARDRAISTLRTELGVRTVIPYTPRHAPELRATVPSLQCRPKQFARTDDLPCLKADARVQSLWLQLPK